MISGTLDKMAISCESGKAEYKFIIDPAQTDQVQINLNAKLNSKISINFTGNIYCKNCGNKTKTSFAQGHCYRCMTKKAHCDQCMVRPELCHYHQGTCREPEWGQQHCLQDHYIYLSNTGAAKVGITRHTNIPSRWLDQGAEQAIAVLKVTERLYSGKLEVALKANIADKTNWRKMLQSDFNKIDLLQKWAELKQYITSDIDKLRQQYGIQSVTEIIEPQLWQVQYPVLQYPQKIISLNPSKQSLVSGVLMGIKGQYLLLDSGVINIRKYRGYEVNFS